MHGRGAEGCPATLGLLRESFQRLALHESVGARPFRRRMHTSSLR
jgi:hypothetical protein